MIALYIVLALLALLIAILAINTVRNKPHPAEVQKRESLDLDDDALAKHLSGMIRCKTITASTMEGINRKEFHGFHKYLEKTYPLMHKALEKEVVNEYSLLYHWKGSGSDKKPFLMMAHMDVVPVEESTAGDWEHEAFSGDIADGYVWGRGTIDMKGQLAAIFESVEHLLGEGYVPKRDIYVAIGHDEESIGQFGAAKVAERLKDMGVRFDFVIDEGRRGHGRQSIGYQGHGRHDRDLREGLRGFPPRGEVRGRTRFTAAQRDGGGARWPGPSSRSRSIR